MIPENLKSQVVDFIDFLTSKEKKEEFKNNKSKFGSGKGILVMKPGFDEPL